MKRVVPDKKTISERQLWSRASDIWAACRGLGWTLDSERAIKLIQKHLSGAVTDCLATNENLRKAMKVQEGKLQKLRHALVTRNKIIRELRNACAQDDSKWSAGMAVGGLGKEIHIQARESVEREARQEEGDSPGPCGSAESRQEAPSVSST